MGFGLGVLICLEQNKRKQKCENISSHPFTYSFKMITLLPSYTCWNPFLQFLRHPTRVRIIIIIRLIIIVIIVILLLIIILTILIIILIIIMLIIII